MTRSNRTGFTLIELLVVIAILTVLAALTSGAYFRIRAAQMVSSTEATLTQVSTGFDRIWSASRDQAEKEFTSSRLPGANNYDALVTYCFAGAVPTAENDRSKAKERAKALWMYLRMKNEFPQTFMESHNTITLGNAISLPPKTTFTSKVPAWPTNCDSAVTAANMANSQAAVLLYLILTEKGARGETFGSDTLSARSATITLRNTLVNPAQTRTFTVFTDAWGTPLTYIRFFSSSDVNQRPFARHVSLSGSDSQDPFDVNFRLPDNSPGAFQQNGNPDSAAAQRGAAARTVIGISPQLFKNTRNWIPVIASAGPNREWNSLNVLGVPFAGTDSNTGLMIDDLATDNLYSYRLRQFGARGD